MNVDVLENERFAFFNLKVFEIELNYLRRIKKVIRNKEVEEILLRVSCGEIN